MDAAELDRLDDLADAWNRNGSPLRLHEYLGISESDYIDWVQQSGRFRVMVADVQKHLVAGTPDRNTAG